MGFSFIIPSTVPGIRAGVTLDIREGFTGQISVELLAMFINELMLGSSTSNSSSNTTSM